ncbi:MAG: hypothetical protein OXI17_02045 [Gammaproteobacteria bacterium]|nr:hypothetical protein [Gammaproteobacteria bacterium]MDE0507401.1 hypothetical protein [Gammaproteobacteria bacterium]
MTNNDDPAAQKDLFIALLEYDRDNEVAACPESALGMLRDLIADDLGEDLDEIWIDLSPGLWSAQQEIGKAVKRLIVDAWNLRCTPEGRQRETNRRSALGKLHELKEIVERL